jgi:hypothetical protein
VITVCAGVSQRVRSREYASNPLEEKLVRPNPNPSPSPNPNPKRQTRSRRSWYAPLPFAACCPLLPAAARCCPLLPAAARCCPLLPAAAHIRHHTASLAARAVRVRVRVWVRVRTVGALGGQLGPKALRYFEKAYVFLYILRKSLLFL